MTFLSFASSLATSWAILCIILLVVLYAIRTLTASRIDFPPGPRPLPLIGNVHQLPTEHQAETFLDWGLKYGSSYLPYYYIATYLMRAQEMCCMYMYLDIRWSS